MRAGMQRPCPDTGGGNNLHGRGGLLQRQGEPLAPPHSCLATYPPQLGSPALRLRSRWCLLHGVWLLSLASPRCVLVVGHTSVCQVVRLQRALRRGCAAHYPLSSRVSHAPCSSPCSAQILIQTLFVGSMSLLKVFALICITQI